MVVVLLQSSPVNPIFPLSLLWPAAPEPNSGTPVTVWGAHTWMKNLTRFAFVLMIKKLFADNEEHH